MSKEEINADNLKRWNHWSKVKVEGVKPPVTILHNKPLPDKMVAFVDNSDKEKEEKKDKKKYEKKRRIKWIKEHSKREYELTDGQNERLKVYFPQNPETGEKRGTLWISDEKYGSLTKSNYIQLRLELDKWFGLHKFVSRRDEGKLTLKIIKEKYGIELLLMLAEKDTITTQEFADKINLKDQDSRKYLNKFEKLGLLNSHKYKIGGVKIFKSALTEKKLKEIVNIF